MIQLRSNPNDKLIELGGGSHPLIRPNVDCRMCQNEKGEQTVDFTADFNEPLPIQSNEWDGVFSQYALEHVSWRKVPQFISEMFRILKPGGKVVVIVPNTEAQLQWIRDNPSGWDDHNAFESCSCILYGDNDYPENTHRAYFSPVIVQELFSAAGFKNIVTQAYGTRNTDMVIESTKPVENNPTARIEASVQGIAPPVSISPNILGSKVEQKNNPVADLMQTEKGRAEVFDKAYFNGGGKYGGYAREGYWDYPVHELTARHVLARKPESVLEIGCGRGYILKRIQDAGIPAHGLEISRHCVMTRVADNVIQWDICKSWPSPHGIERKASGIGDWWNLCVSCAVLEHIPEQFLPAMIKEMQRTCKRGLHGIDFGDHDDGFDQSHCSLHPHEWWIGLFNTHAPGWPVEIVNKEELEAGDFPVEVLRGDGRLKLNVGSFTTMFHHGWTNTDIHDLTQFAGKNYYGFLHNDARQGLPYGTGTVDCIFASHFLEHLTYAEGLSFLREARRVIRTDGAMRLLVPDTKFLMQRYMCSVTSASDTVGALWTGEYDLDRLDEINDGAANAPTAAGKLWALLHEGHASCYDEETLTKMLNDAGWNAHPAKFRYTTCGERHKQILRESIEMEFAGLSLFMDATPKTA